MVVVIETSGGDGSAVIKYAQYNRGISNVPQHKTPLNNPPLQIMEILKGKGRNKFKIWIFLWLQP